jgi:hypothetical protein
MARRITIVSGENLTGEEYTDRWNGIRARVLFKKYTATATSGGPELRQLRRSAATHLGDQKVPLQLIMAKTRHRSPRTVMRYVKPGDAAVAEVTSLLGLPRRSH